MRNVQMKVVHNIQNLATGRVLNFYITDYIQADGEQFNYQTYTWETAESTTSQRYFVENLADVKEGDTLNLYINSMGGSVKEALGIYNALRRCPATVNAYIDGFAASAASIIAVAADRVVMPRNTTMMVHNASWGIYGNSAALRKSADDLDIINAAMLQSYVVKAGEKLTMEKLEELADGETWLSAEDCVLYGLADEFAEQEADLTTAAKQYQQAQAAAKRTASPALPAAMAAAVAALGDGTDPSTPPAEPTPAPPQKKPEETGCLYNVLAAMIN